MTERKIICHASGDRCHGCAHYRGEADTCDHAQCTRASVIEECAKLIESGAGMADLIDQQELDQQAAYLRALAAQCAPQPSGEPIAFDWDAMKLADREYGDERGPLNALRQRGWNDCIDWMRKRYPTPPAVSCAAREALAEWVAVRQDMNGMALLGKDKDESDEQRKVREAKWTRLGHAEHALMAAALSLPAAGGEASKREAEIVERCAKIAEHPAFVEARDSDWDLGFNYAKELTAKAIRASLRKDG